MQQKRVGKGIDTCPLLSAVVYVCRCQTLTEKKRTNSILDPVNPRNRNITKSNCDWSSISCSKANFTWCKIQSRLHTSVRQVDDASEWNYLHRVIGGKELIFIPSDDLFDLLRERESWEVCRHAKMKFDSQFMYSPFLLLVIGDVRSLVTFYDKRCSSSDQTRDDSVYIDLKSSKKWAESAHATCRRKLFTIFHTFASLLLLRKQQLSRGIKLAIKPSRVRW